MDRAPGPPTAPAPAPDLDPVTLRFREPALEARYQAFGRAEGLVPFRLAGLLAILVFLLVAGVSITIEPVPAALAVPACALLVGVVLAALAIAPRTRSLDDLHLVGAGENVAAGIAAFAVPALAGELEQFAPQAVLFAVLWAFVVLRLRFAMALGAVAAYLVPFTALELVSPHPVGLGLVLVPLYASVVALAASAWLLERSVRRGFFDRELIASQRQALAEAKAESDRLLLNVLPAPIAERLKRGEGPIADGFDEVSVLFADLVGFTPFADSRPPEDVVAFLDRLFTTFDQLSDRHGLEKIKTIGDAYMAVAGLPEARAIADHADRAVAMGLDMLAAVDELRARTGLPLRLRVGVNSGRVVAGVIGRRKFSYDLWGDTVNVASRLEASGVAGRIHLSAATRERLRGGPALEPRGPVELKGKGRVETWLVAAPAPR